LLRPREIAYYLSDSGARLLIAAADHIEAALEGARQSGGISVVSAGGATAAIGSTAGLEAIISDHPPSERLSQRDPTDAAVLLYTSGTTGRPKGALLTHSNLLWNAEISSELHLISAGDTLLGTLPLFHSFGQTCVMNAAFRRRAEVVLMPRFEAAAALKLIARHRVTVFIGVPTMYIALLAETSAPADMPSIRLCVSGGASLPADVLREFEDRFRCRVLEGYGLSETSPVASFNHLDRPSKIGSIGTPIWGTEMRVVDENGQPLSTGEIGEIAIRGHHVMAGYHDRPDETSLAIDVDGWFRTGDLGRTDEDGYFFIVDRKKDMILRGGYNVYPREIEELLYEYPGILEAAVFGVPHPQLGEEVAAAVVARPGETIDADALRAWIRDQVAPYKYPRQITVVDSLPKSATGKILKRELTSSTAATTVSTTAAG
jgi:long-chain acyl-CoA synthetase